MYEKLENIMIQRIVRRQEIANEKILKEIGKVLADIGELRPSELHTIKKQLQYGESLDKIIKILSETSKINELEIYKMLEKSADISLEEARKYYIARGIDYVPYSENIALKSLVREIGYVTLKTYRNISRTTGITFLDKTGNKVTKDITSAYYEIVDDAINNVAMGKETFFEALHNQIKTIGQNGIQSIEYESGYHRRIDSALNMNLSDGLNQLSIAQQEFMGRQFGANMMEVTHHENSAPDHIDSVDGKQFVKLDILIKQIKNGEEKKIKLEDIKENGLYYKGKWYYDYDYINFNLKRKVGTLNCYHRAFAKIIGIDKPRYTKEELQKDKENNEKGFEYENIHYTNYEGEQLLRKIELELRKTRETKILAKSSKDKDTLEKLNSRENKLVLKYHEVLKVSGLESKLERTRILTK